jgi:preprotein translocase subunit SecD
MNRRNYIILAIIVVLVGVSLWINLPNGGIHIGSFSRSLDTVLGLDLRGGMQVLLEADVPATTAVDAQSLEDAKKIIENRSNGLGVSEVVFQIAGDRRIVGEFPGLTNTEDVIAVLKQTGQLEFVDMGSTYIPEGTKVKTDAKSSSSSSATGGVTSTPVSETPTAAASASATPAADATATPAAEEVVYHTVMTGSELKSVSVSKDTLGKYYIAFTLSSDGAKTFSTFTTKNINKYLGIVMDNTVISCPVIEAAITDGSGIIQGSFTQDSANNLAIQLRYGSLPIPLKVVQSQIVGPTLGEDSLRKSLIAGIIGLAVVMAFMIIYYRFPGIIADLAILVYALLTFAIFKLIPVTLTLPGIAGLLIGLGSAVDANILIFERMKEELMSGRTLKQAVHLGWTRAWPSIRDSNIATIITCIVLFWFGSAYGASIVKGFAVTLILGVFVSLFTAVTVTRTFLELGLDIFKPTNYPRWFGL